MLEPMDLSSSVAVDVERKNVRALADVPRTTALAPARVLLLDVECRINARELPWVLSSLG